MLQKESMLNSAPREVVHTLLPKLHLRSFKQKKKGNDLEAKPRTLLIYKRRIESFHQANHRRMTIFFPDSSTRQLATHSPINTTVMVGNSTPHPAADVTAVGLCMCVCVCVCLCVCLHLSVFVCVWGLRVGLFYGFANHRKLISGYQTKNDFTHPSYWAFVQAGDTHIHARAHTHTHLSHTADNEK